ncbi:hypothetical protein ACOSQ3_007689 [Xanthoceras sorbifolium]
MHALWSCNLLKSVRNRSGLVTKIHKVDNLKFFYFILLCKNQLLEAEFELLRVILWRNWFKRNSWLHESKLEPVADVVTWSSAFLHEFRMAMVKPLPPLAPVVVSCPCRWTPPTLGLVQMNCDATIDEGRKLVGLGVVLRDHFGRVLGSSWQRMAVGFSPAIAEATAIFRGLRFALDLGVSLSLVESDASSVVGLINGSADSSTDIGLVILDIKRCLVEFPNCSISFVPRAANSVTHSLAKLALSSCEYGFFIDVVAPCVESLILADLPGLIKIRT